MQIDLVIGPKDGFSNKLAQSLNCEFAELKRKVFPDMEVKPTLTSGNVEGKNVLLVNRMKAGTEFKPNEYLMELLLSLKNLKEKNSKHITLLMPYFVYASQDKVFLEGEPLSAKFVLELLNAAGADKIITVNSHVKRDEGPLTLCPGIDVYNISVFPAIGEYIKNNYNLKDPVALSPDFTASTSAKEVATVLGIEEATLQKKRDLHTGNIETTGEVDVDNKDVVIVDDFTRGGSTQVNAINMCKKSNANKIIATVVHAVMIKDCLKKLQETGADILASNTIESDVSKIDIIPTVVTYLKGCDVFV